jgi:membrane protein YqaA with SNARE-associated domain
MQALTSTAVPAKLAARQAHHSLVPHWLTHLGSLGLFAVAIVDSSVIPLPLPGSADLLLLILVSHRGNVWLLTASAIVGSIIGGYTCWTTGKKGGEAALQRYVQPKILKRISGWVEHHPILSLFIPSLLPPPIPLMPFLLATGAFGLSRQRFLLVFGLARSLRFCLIAWLGITYGRGVVRLWSQTLDKWSGPLLWAFVLVLIGSAAFAIWKFRSLQKADKGGYQPLRPAPVRAE